MKWAILTRRRSVPHIERKVYHLVMGLFCFALYAFVLSREAALTILGCVGGVWVMMDISRLWFPALNRLTLKYFGKVMRREELKSITGNSFFILGLIAILYFFPKPIVLMSVLFLAIGDPLAALVGTRYGRHKIIGSKSLEGALANWVGCTFALFLFGIFYMRLPMDRVASLAVVGGLVSVAVELIPFPRVDDNFTIPFFSAIALTLLNSVFLWF